MDDFEAIVRLKQGEICGLEWLIAHHQLKAVRTAFLITHDEHLAEDVVQNVFLRFFHKVHHFDQTRPFEPYFLRCVVNAALDGIQKGCREVPFYGNDDGLVIENLLSQARSVETQVEFCQLKREILDALARLSPRQRTVIIQRYYLEMSEQEMAREMEIAPGTVKWLLNAARTRLRTMLKTEGSVE